VVLADLDVLANLGKFAFDFLSIALDHVDQDRLQMGALSYLGVRTRNKCRLMVFNLKAVGLSLAQCNGKHLAPEYVIFEIYTFAPQNQDGMPNTSQQTFNT